VRVWTIIPVLSLASLAVAWGGHPTGPAAIALEVVLAAAVLAAVHHAEVLGHRLGEPFGSLLLAVAVTIIEVGLIVTLTVGGDNDSLARDTVFAAFMIATNGVIGASLLAATLRGKVARFNAEGTGAMLAALTTVGALSLVLPNYTASSPGPTYTQGQLILAAVGALTIYLLFVFVQNVRHRDQFEPVVGDATGEGHDPLPSDRQSWTSLALLLAALVSVVGLAKTISDALEGVVVGAGLPVSFVGVLIGLLVLAPEGITAVRSARGDEDVQRSFNLAYGSAMASIGLTIPVIAVLSIAFDLDLLLGLRSVDVAMMALTIVVSVLTVTPGRATLLQAGVHLTIFGAWLGLAMMP
jgi:Ca2+:H+ antiporter